MLEDIFVVGFMGVLLVIVGWALPTIPYAVQMY